MTTTTSTSLVETVNINVDDFSETFLTCSTCLYTYDGNTRKPKLLPCSHSVCLYCVTQLAELAPETIPPTIRCPLCREICAIPHGGVIAFPAAFFINQLLDVMQRQRKDVVPSCSNHPSDQLLYCETCDLVFCEHCQSSVINKKCDEHTVVPLSIAIKRMSEIVVYRAKGRLRALDDAHVAVNKEIVHLDGNVDKIVEQINAAIQEVSNLVENRRRVLIETVRVRRDEKRKVLKDQLEVIQDEKKKLQKDLESCKMDIRSMARQLKDGAADDNWQRRIIEPRENAFLRINTNSEQMLIDVEKNLNEFGKLYASNTFPGTSTIEAPSHMGVHVENMCTLITRDVDGIARKTGGDPVEVDLELVALDAHLSTNRLADASKKRAEEEVKNIRVTDDNDGTYQLGFKLTHPGDYQISVKIFGRPVANSPLQIRIDNWHCYDWQMPVTFLYPTKCWWDEPSKRMFVLDSGNKRVRVLKEDGDVITDPVLSFPVRETKGAEVKCVAVGMDDDVIVGTTDELLLYDSAGRMLRKLNVSPPGTPMPKHGGRFNVTTVTCDVSTGQIVVIFTDKIMDRTTIGVVSYKGDFLYSIEPGAQEKFQAPCGIFVHKNKAFVTDFESNTVRSYKYK
ncbi:Protein CBR-NHL-3 [Caenorhabditis briggsae]|uniref:Protein CBR-NHL-3 n=1 Tax=Caenorhabditis briggsae TaxID=6238 RepID=A8X3Q7_CAEBR|nr:Protein CBR-NHL-3 [Caenorhabditis briggsae]CAP27267.2 Protein CBR-NHL-3 [Caenorhabditis briggsae]